MSAAIVAVLAVLLAVATGHALWREWCQDTETDISTLTDTKESTP